MHSKKRQNSGIFLYSSLFSFSMAHFKKGTIFEIDESYYATTNICRKPAINQFVLDDQKHMYYITESYWLAREHIGDLFKAEVEENIRHGFLEVGMRVLPHMHIQISMLEELFSLDLERETLDDDVDVLYNLRDEYDLGASIQVFNIRTTDELFERLRLGIRAPKTKYFIFSCDKGPYDEKLVVVEADSTLLKESEVEDIIYQTVITPMMKSFGVKNHDVEYYAIALPNSAIVGRLMMKNPHMRIYNAGNGWEVSGL